MAASNDYKLISADSHVVEPPTIFEAGLPASLRGRAPKLVAHDGGSVWSVDGELVPLPSTAATGSGWHRAADGPLTDGPVSWDAVLPALYDPRERVQAAVVRQCRRRGPLSLDRALGRDQDAR